MKRLVLLALAGLLAACSGGGDKAVEEPICQPGERSCTADNSGLQECGKDGLSWLPLETCISGATCYQGLCQCPEGEVAGSDQCVAAGLVGCADAFTAVANGCTVEPAGCGAGEIWAGGVCHAVGVESCPEGFAEEPEGDGCLVPAGACSDEEDWAIATGCVLADLDQDCGNLESPWPEELPEGTVVYVWSESPEVDEEGSQSRPFKSLAAGLAAAEAGDTIVLGKGTYAGGFALDTAVSIVGKCPQYVTIDGGGPYTPAGEESEGRFVLYGTPGGAVELSGFTLSDTALPEDERAAGIFLHEAPGSTVHDILFSGLAGAALDVGASANVLVHNIRVEDLVPVAGLNPYGQTCYGLYADGAAGLTVTNSRFLRSQGTDIRVKGACPTLAYNHLEARGGLGGLPPMGIWLTGCTAGTAVLEANWFDRKMTHAILVEEAPVEIVRNTIIGLVTDYDDANGPAIKVVESEFTIRANYLLENQYAGINVVGGKGTIEGNRVEGGLPSDPGLKNGDGIIIKDCDPGPVLVRDNTLVANTRNGVLVTASIVKLERNVIRETQRSPAANALFGAGINVVDGADVTFTGNSITANHRMGIRFDNAYGWVQGNVIAETEPDEDGRCGGGVVIGGTNSSYLQNGIRENLFSANHCAGIYAVNANIGEIAGNVVLGTQQGEGTLGIGIVLVDTVAPVAANWFKDNEDSGLLFHASTGTISDNVFEGNGHQGKGGGLVLQDSLHPMVEVHGNTFSGNGLAGFIARNSYLELRRNALLENLPNKEGVGGAGGWFEEQSEGDARSNTVWGNRLAGMLAFNVADITFSLNYVAETTQGALPAGETPIQLADGIVVAAGSYASVLYNGLVKNDRSGVVFFESEGVVTGNTLRSNGDYGLALANSQLTVEDNLYVTNGAGDDNPESVRTGPAEALGPWEPCSMDP